MKKWEKKIIASEMWRLSAVYDGAPYVFLTEKSRKYIYNEFKVFS